MGLVGDHFLKAGQIESLRPRVTFTMCVLWQIQRADGVILRFASHDKPVKFEGETFTPLGISSQNMQTGEAGAAADFEIIGFLSHDTIRPRDIRKGAFDGATITQWVTDWQRPWCWTKKHKWWIRSIVNEGQTYKADVAGVDQFLEVKTGRYYEKECDKTFLGTECAAQGVPSFTGKSITEVPSTATGGKLLGISRDTRAFKVDMSGETLSFTPPGGSAANDITWAVGTATFQSGSNKGKSIQIQQAEYDGSQYLTVILARPAPWVIRVGDTLDLRPGCDGSFTSCKVLYNNLPNFGGQHRMPTTEDQYVTPELDDVEEI